MTMSVVSAFESGFGLGNWPSVLTVLTPSRIKIVETNLIISRFYQKPNGGVDAAARIHSSIAARVMMRNTLPPLASNDLLVRDGKGEQINDHAVSH
jgi:hypothetical protein